MENSIKINYRQKYLKYKYKYNHLKLQSGGGLSGSCTICKRECNLIKIADNLLVCCLFCKNNQDNNNKLNFHTDQCDRNIVINTVKCPECNLYYPNSFTDKCCNSCEKLKNIKINIHDAEDCPNQKYCSFCGFYQNQKTYPIICCTECCKTDGMNHDLTCDFNNIFNDPVYELIKDPTYISDTLVNPCNDCFIISSIQFINRMRDFVQYIVSKDSVNHILEKYPNTGLYYVVMLFRHLNNLEKIDTSDINMKIRIMYDLGVASQGDVIDFLGKFFSNLSDLFFNINYSNIFNIFRVIIGIEHNYFLTIAVQDDQDDLIHKYINENNLTFTHNKYFIVQLNYVCTGSDRIYIQKNNKTHIGDLEFNHITYDYSKIIQLSLKHNLSNYDLVGILCHTGGGGHDSGHYVSYIKYDQWYLYDDNKKTPIDIDHTIRSDHQFIFDNTPRLLLYELN